MEIKYSNFSIDTDIYGENEIIGIYDENSNYIYNNFYDVNEVNYNKNVTVSKFLNKYYLFNKKLLAKIFEYFEFDKEYTKRKLSKLSSSELIKILYIKLIFDDSKLIIFDNVDSILNSKDIKKMINIFNLDDELSNKDKRIIFVSNNIDNVVTLTNRYVISKNEELLYNGNNINEIPIDTSIKKFINIANKKNANLILYKERNDLLKAIYRSVKK